MAVNDDSVGTWFIDAISGFFAEREMLLDLVIEIRTTPPNGFAMAACKAR